MAQSHSTSKKSADDRFFSKVRLPRENGCWPWMASKNTCGYGNFWGGERRESNNSPILVLAHRWIYERCFGPIPEGMNVLHSCDEPDCVYPKHLFLGTQADNVADCAAKGRRNQRHLWKLTSEQWDEIRTLYKTGEFTYAALGRRFGVTYQHIRHIVNKR